MSNIDSSDRRALLSVLSQASADRVLSAWQDWTQRFGEPTYTCLRQPEIGTVMVRGRAGAVGAPFNLGEITVTRSSVQLANGTVGHGYHQGRSKPASLAVALIDALAQGEQARKVEDQIVGPLLEAKRSEQRRRAAKADATKVEFFTMVRGES